MNPKVENKKGSRSLKHRRKRGKVFFLCGVVVLWFLCAFFLVEKKTFLLL